MAGEPDPTLSPNECNYVPLTDREDLSTVPQPQQQQDARRKVANERRIHQPCSNLGPAPLSERDRLEAKIGLGEEGFRRQLSPTARTHARPDCIGQNTISDRRAWRPCLPVSSSFMDLDTESQQELNNSLALERDLVQRRAIEERCVAALTSQANDSSSRLPPLSSGEIAEEEGERKEHDQPPIEGQNPYNHLCTCHIL